MAVNQTWNIGFASDAIARLGAISRRIKCLTVADDFSHECAAITSDFGIGVAYVTSLLDRAATFRGYPKQVRTDNGPEFTCRALMTWTQKHGIKIPLGSVGPRVQRKLGLVYAIRSRLARYSRGLSKPRDIWIYFWFYERIQESTIWMNWSIVISCRFRG